MSNSVDSRLDVAPSHSDLSDQHIHWSRTNTWSLVVVNIITCGLQTACLYFGATERDNECHTDQKGISLSDWLVVFSVIDVITLATFNFVVIWYNECKDNRHPIFRRLAYFVLLARLFMWSWFIVGFELLLDEQHSCIQETLMVVEITYQVLFGVVSTFLFRHFYRNVPPFSRIYCF